MARTRATTATRILTTLIAAAGLSSGAYAAPRAVVELFTSQGCSSCPPADRLLAKLAHQPDLIALSLPVDYWDRLGWKDTLAKHAFTERQVAYSKMRGDGEVYTPQAVVNGREHAVGSQRSDIDAAIADTAQSLSVPLNVERAGDDIVVSVGGAQGQAAHATLVLLPVLAAREVAIGRGENARSTVTYTNIVRDILPLGDWSGAPMRRTIPASTLRGYDGLVVLLQTGSPREPGAIIGAGRTALRSFPDRDAD
jgi:hypothetical protein